MNTSEKAAIVLAGQSGLAHVFEDRVFLERPPRGCLAVLFGPYPAASKTIPIEHITAVQIKEAGLTVGFIQFTVPGGREGLGGALEAVKDENTVTFIHKNQVSTAREIHDFIMAKKRQQRDVSTSSAATAPASAPSTADELIKLKSLLDAGVLTRDEFESQKKKLLG